MQLLITTSKMAFNNGKTSVFAVILAFLAASNFLEVDPIYLKVEETGVYLQKSDYLFEYLTDSQHVPEVCIQALLLNFEY